MTKRIPTDRPFFSNHHEFTHKIAQFWNRISYGWLTIWGPHIHHGLYDNDQDISPIAAQEKLIDKLASLIESKPQDKLLDAGCGMGGTSLYLARHYGIRATGISLSQKQIAMAQEQAQKQTVEGVVFQLEDALKMQSQADASFDIVWSLESCEQFYDKRAFIQEAYRVLKPGGKLMLATWCSDQEIYEGHRAQEYRKLCQAFDLPYMPTLQYYQRIISEQGFELNYIGNWSHWVAKSWKVGLSLISAYHFISILKLGGFRGLRFAKQIVLMDRAFTERSVVYGVFVATKL